MFSFPHVVHQNLVAGTQQKSTRWSSPGWFFVSACDNASQLPKLQATTAIEIWQNHSESLEIKLATCTCCTRATACIKNWIKPRPKCTPVIRSRPHGRTGMSATARHELFNPRQAELQNCLQGMRRRPGQHCNATREFANNRALQWQDKVTF